MGERHGDDDRVTATKQILVGGQRDVTVPPGTGTLHGNRAMANMMPGCPDALSFHGDGDTWPACGPRRGAVGI